MLTRHMGVNVLDTSDLVPRNVTEVFDVAEQGQCGGDIDALGLEVHIWEGDGLVDTDIVDITEHVSKGTTVQCSVAGCTREYVGANASKSKCAAARVRAM